MHRRVNSCFFVCWNSSNGLNMGISFRKAIFLTRVSYTELAYYYVELMLWYNKIYFFVLRKGTNGNVKGRVLHCKTRPFGNVLILNELRAGS